MHPASPSSPALRSSRTALRLAAVAAVLVATLPAAALVAFIAQVRWTGCFLSCEEPDRPLGAAFALLAAALLLAGPLLTARLWGSRTLALSSLGLLPLLTLGQLLVYEHV